MKEGLVPVFAEVRSLSQQLRRDAGCCFSQRQANRDEASAAWDWTPDWTPLPSHPALHPVRGNSRLAFLAADNAFLGAT